MLDTNGDYVFVPNAQASGGQITLITTDGSSANGQTVVGQTLNSQVNPGEREAISGGAAPIVFTASPVAPTAAAPGRFFPTGSASGGLSSGGYTGGGGAGSIFTDSDILVINYDDAMLAATTACSSGSQAACDGALRTLVAATLARYDGSTLVVLQDNVLLTLRQVVALVREVSGPAGSRAINIATIDTAFARAFPESTRTRPSSPS